MPNIDPPDLFAADGLKFEEHRLRSKPISRSKRLRKPKPPTPAERAAAVRLEGGRRSRGPASCGRNVRVGAPRDLRPAPVVAFPLSRNVKALAEVIAGLPQDDGADLDAFYDREARRIERSLIRKSFSRQSAWSCDADVVLKAYAYSVHNSRKEH